MNKIKFICGDSAVAEHFPIVPASKMRPEWYSKLRPWVGEPHQSYPTIKKCMPVNDFIQGGYIVPNPVEQQFNIAPRPDTGVQGFSREYPGGWTIQAPQEGHEHEQCPVQVIGLAGNAVTLGFT